MDHILKGKANTSSTIAKSLGGSLANRRLCRWRINGNRSQIHPEPELCHLFTDGSCHGGRHRLYQLAAWAVVSATNDCCVANGVLGGLGQDNDRAELRAVIAAVQYAIEMQKNTVIWTDSTFAAEGMVRLLHDAADLPEGHCGEDRVELQGLLCHGEVQLQIHHVPWSRQVGKPGL